MKRTWLKSVLGHGHRWRWSWEWRDQVLALHRAQAIIEFSPDGIILDANENFLRTVGYERRDIVGKHHRIFVRPEERESEAYRQFWLRLGQGHHDSGLYRRIGKDGREVWIQGSYSPILDRRGRPYKIIKHATDVSDERLQASDTEGQLSAINRSQAVISFDLDGIILDANDNFLTTMGYRREEVVGRHHRMFVDPAERESAEYRDFWTRLRRGEYNAALYRRVRKDGADVWIQASYNPIFDMAGRPFKIVKYATDVTRQTSAARMLQESLGSLADTVPAIAGQARQTSRLAHEASESASNGGAMVDQLIDVIGQISRRTEDMSDIIGLIDSIAFQTNILAINAAVEAAHAGEHGRGFGVVAQEVRGLAQRSAQSARDIRDLIQNTIDALAQSGVHARLAGEAMHTIVSSALQVNEHVGKIARAADSQASGLELVNRAMTQLEAREPAVA